MVREQCEDCGKLFRRQLPHSALASRRPEELSRCDLKRADAYDENYHAVASALREVIRQASSASWWRQYTAYLQTPEWKRRAEAAIRAAGGLCTVCRIRKATQAHHLAYDRVGHEMPEDLRAVCVPCHQVEHPHRLLSEWDAAREFKIQRVPFE